MKFSTITALAVLGSNVCVAAYEIPNNKVIGKIVDEYLEQDPEGGEWSQECLDESQSVQVCVVDAIEADPAWGTRVGQAGETLIDCTKGLTITDEAEWEKCLTPYFTLLSEKCDLSPPLEACFEEDVHFAAEVAQDIEYAAMIATDAAFLEEETIEEDPCSIAEDALDACISEAVATDPVWTAGYYAAQGKFAACVYEKTFWGVTDPAEFLECQEINLTYIESRCDLTTYREVCPPFMNDFHLDLAEDLKLEKIAEEVVAEEFEE